MEAQQFLVEQCVSLVHHVGELEHRVEEQEATITRQRLEQRAEIFRERQLLVDELFRLRELMAQVVNAQPCDPSDFFADAARLRAAFGITLRVDPIGNNVPGACLSCDWLEQRFADDFERFLRSNFRNVCSDETTLRVSLDTAAAVPRELSGTAGDIVMAQPAGGWKHCTASCKPAEFATSDDEDQDGTLWPQYLALINRCIDLAKPVAGAALMMFELKAANTNMQHGMCQAIVAAALDPRIKTIVVISPTEAMVAESPWFGVTAEPRPYGARRVDATTVRFEGSMDMYGSRSNKRTRSPNHGMLPGGSTVRGTVGKPSASSDLATHVEHAQMRDAATAVGLWIARVASVPLVETTADQLDWSSEQ